MQQRTAQLNAANADLEAFSYSVSHDLRGPLRHIGAFSRILSEEHDAKMDPDARHLLRRIQNGVTNMTELVDGLLRMSQIGRTELACVATDLNSLLKDVVADLQPEWENRHVDWHIGDLRPWIAIQV